MAIEWNRDAAIGNPSESGVFRVGLRQLRHTEPAEHRSGAVLDSAREPRNADHLFNTAAFSTPAPYTFGDAGRDIIPGPGNQVVDAALHRRFSIGERRTLEIRTEVFNSLNTPNLGIPGPYPDFGPFFGKAFSAGQPRRLQFAMRYDF